MKATKRMMTFACAAAAFACAGGTIVYKTGFETPEETKGWRSNAVWKVEAGAGANGSKALVWTNRDPKKYDICNFPISGAAPGRMYKARFKVKAYSLEGGNVGCTICWTGNGKWIGGAGGTDIHWGDRRLKPDASGWYDMTITTPAMPFETEKAMLQLYVNPGCTGRVAFDDVSIEYLGEKAEFGKVYGIATSCYRNIAADGDVKVVVTMDVPMKYRESGQTSATLSFRGADGRIRRVPMLVPDGVHAEVTLPVDSLAMGRHRLSAVVKGEDGRFFGSCETDFERVAALPDLHIRFDRHGRTLVDGRPFFPLGMFWSIGTLEKSTNCVEKYAAGPFNCLMNYDMTLTPAQLDRYWSHGLRVIVGVKDVFAPVPPNIIYPHSNLHYARPQQKGLVLKTWADEDAYLTKLANSLKDHPALLGWYLCDEFRNEFHERLRDHYELMKALDPGHPAFISICSHGAERVFMDCTDAIGFDAYSIRSRKPVAPPGSGEAWLAADTTRKMKNDLFGMLNVWMVPQAFANKWDNRKDKNDPRVFPTFEEMKSQSWQEIAEGANGLLFYSYSQILNCPDTDEEKESHFRITCAVAKEIRDMFPVLLLEPGPSAAEVPQRVRVRTWKDGESVYALICNTHPERRTGSVKIGNGGWKTCEAVFGGGASLAGGAVSLDMQPFGVTIVRLAHRPRCSRECK